MSSNKDASLYGIPRPKKRKAQEISASNSLAFSSNLSALISSSATAPRNAPARPRAKKDDIFAVHNKNAKQRALKDLGDSDFTQKHSTSSDAVDNDTWNRARRKLEDKARLYDALKRGEVEDADEKYGVDFDRKWAENQASGLQEDSSDGDEQGSDEELIEYVDEFGRTRHGTRAEAARAERSNNGGSAVVDEPGVPGARPNMPQSVIFGDTIQSQAFNPERDIAEKMADLAAKRDREPTPPPDEHFDGKREIRTKGVGFFQFSDDIEERKKQMEFLEKERAETERRRAETAQRKEERKKELEARKKAIAAKRGKAHADRFLDGLMDELQDKIGDNQT
jgi:coiled-coil domain-containing protein 174